MKKIVSILLITLVVTAIYSQTAAVVIKPGKTDVKTMAKDYASKLQTKYTLTKEQVTSVEKLKLEELNTLRELEKKNDKFLVPATDLMLAEGHYMEGLMLILMDKYTLYANDKIAYMDMMLLDNLTNTNALLVEDEIGLYPLDFSE